MHTFCVYLLRSLYSKSYVSKKKLREYYARGQAYASIKRPPPLLHTLGQCKPTAPRLVFQPGPCMPGTDSFRSVHALHLTELLTT